MYAGELRVAELAERLGFDSLWAVEHHFDDYAMCPDNMVFLANVGTHFKDAKGYERYDEVAAKFREAGLEGAANAYAVCALTGTPDQIAAKLADIRQALGGFELTACCPTCCGSWGWNDARRPGRNPAGHGVLRRPGLDRRAPPTPACPRSSRRWVPAVARPP
jgi:hypothetical protein